MSRRFFLLGFLLLTSSELSATIQFSIAIEHIDGTGNSKRYIQKLSVWDDAPAPNSTGHVTNYAVKNSDGWNIPYKINLFIKTTNDGNIPLPDNSNVTTSYSDWTTADQVLKTAELDIACINNNKSPLISQYIMEWPTIKYNCHAFARGELDVWIDDNFYFYNSFCYPITHVPDWREPEAGEEPDIATDDYSNHSARIIASDVWDGKFGMHGRYATDPSYHQMFYQYGFLLLKSK